MGHKKCHFLVWTVNCVQLTGDESQSFTILPRLTPVPVRRQKLLTIASSDTSAVVEVLQQIPGSAEPELLAQVSFSLISLTYIDSWLTMFSLCLNNTLTVFP